MNEIYRKKLITQIRQTVEDASNAGLLEHKGLRGRARELVISNLLEPYMLPTVGICTGVIIDSMNSQSRQQDIIIYDKRIYPPLLLTEGEGAIPFESVYATIEVKSILTKTELDTCIDNIESVRALKPHPSVLPVSYTGQMYNKFHNPVNTLLAFSSDLKGDKKNELTRAIRVMDKKGHEKNRPPLSVLCIVNKMSAYYGSDADETEDSWHITNHTDEFDEIINFLMLIVHMCTKLSSTRAYPMWGVYIYQDGSEEILNEDDLKIQDDDTHPINGEPGGKAGGKK